MSQDCAQESDWGGCPSPVTPEFVKHVRRLLAGFVHMLEVEQICYKQVEGPHDISDFSLIKLFHELENAEGLATAHQQLQNVGHENKCQGEAGRQLFLFKPNIEGFSEKTRSSISQPTSENLEIILTRLIDSFIHEFTVRRFIDANDCSCVIFCRFCNKPIGITGRETDQFCCEDSAFISKIWKRLTARNNLKGNPVWDENLLTEVLDYIHNKLSSKYDPYGNYRKEIDEYAKQLKSGDYEDRYVKSFIKQRLEGHSAFKTRFDGLETKDVDTSDIFDECPDEVHLPAGYVSADTETNIQGYPGDIPYGYAQVDTLSELQLILNPKDDVKKPEEEFNEFWQCYKVEQGVAQTDISGEVGDIPYGNARMILSSTDIKLKKYAGLDRNKITIDREGRMGTDINEATDKLQEKESEKDVATRRQKNISRTRGQGERRKRSSSDSTIGKSGKNKSVKLETPKRKKRSETSLEHGGKRKKGGDSENVDKKETPKKNKRSETTLEHGDKRKKEVDSVNVDKKGQRRKRPDSESAVEKEGRKEGGKRHKTRSKSSMEIDSENRDDKGRTESKRDSKIGGKRKGVAKPEADRDAAKSKSVSGKSTSGRNRGKGKEKERDRDRSTDLTGMKLKMGRDGGKSSGDWAKKIKSRLETDDLNGGELKNTSSKKSKSPTKSKSLRGTATGIKYQLSDPKFIDMGWTILPKYTDLEKLILYTATPAKTDKNWFCEGTFTREKFYLDGTVFTRCEPDGSGYVFYPDGGFAISVKKSEEGTYTIAYNPSTNNDIGTVAAIFDSIGNGVVYNPSGNIRLIYTQQEGIYYDTSFKVPIKWHWLITGKIKDIVEVEERKQSKKDQFTEGIVKKIERVFAIKERLASLSAKSSVAKSILSGQTSRQQFESEKPTPKKSSTRRKSTVVADPSWHTNGSKLSSSADLIKQEIEKNTSLLLSETSPINIESTESSLNEKEAVNVTGHKFSPLKSIVLKINKYMSLRIFEQEKVNLQINCGMQTLRLELGVHINPKEVLKELMIDVVELHKHPVICYFELFRPPCLDNTLKLLENQRAIAAEEAIKNSLNSC